MTAPWKFPQVDHADAAGELQEVCWDMQATLRIAWVAFACWVLATFPGYLPLAWRAAKPGFATRYAERARTTRASTRCTGWTHLQIS